MKEGETEGKKENESLGTVSGPGALPSSPHPYRDEELSPSKQDTAT